MGFEPPQPGLVANVTDALIAELGAMTWENNRLFAEPDKPKYLLAVRGTWKIVPGVHREVHGLSHWTQTTLVNSRALPDGSVITNNGVMARLQGRVVNGKNLVVLVKDDPAAPVEPPTKRHAPAMAT